MALTNDDKQWIKEAIVEGVNGALETIVLPRFDAVEADISELKRDVSGLKEDVSSLKSDMHEVKSRLDSVESDIREVKDRLNGVESEMREVKNRLGRGEGALCEDGAGLIELGLEVRNMHQVRAHCQNG